MNILCYVPQMAAYGGMERHACGLAAALADAGHRVRLLTTSNSLGPELRSLLAAHRVELRECGQARGTASRALKSLWLLRQILVARTVAWDVIYTNGQSALARLVWGARRAHTRRIHHHHTAADRHERRTWSRHFRRLLARAPEIVACSRATRDEIARTLQRRDVHFLPYLTPDPMGPGHVADRHPAPAEPLHFGFLGRLVAEKGVDRICRLSRDPALADIVWHIHGAGAGYPPSFFAPYPNIRYHGPFAGATAQAAIFRSLDAVVLLSRHNEGMPLSLIEAMSAGLPWLATDQGGTREIAVVPEDARVVPGDVSDQDLAAAVADLARRIRAGDTSRPRQRAAYEAHFAPVRVAAAWHHYFTAGPARPDPAPALGPGTAPRRALIR